MRILEQHKLVSELKDYIGKMTSAEKYDFEMMQKRDKDDEELDQLTHANLESKSEKGRQLMKYRALGKTGINVSEIGYGAWGIGGAMWQGAKDDVSLRALHTAIDLGMNLIDTALVYGDGHSEQLVGKVVKERKERVYVATKVPPKNGKWPARGGTKLRDAFPHDYILQSTETSLRNLGLDTIDILQLHVWNDEWTDDLEWLDAIVKLKQQGKIRHFGVSINDHQPENALRLAATGKVDTFQVIHNIFDQTPEEKLYPFCLKNKIGIIVRVPLDEGGLSGTITPDTRFPEGDFRVRYFRDDRKQQIVEHISKLNKLLGKEAETIPELALRYVLSHPAVSTVIPGMRAVKNVQANCKLSDGRLLSEKLMAELRNHRWDRNFYR
jgi:aryl-alcohol dehydrogenase-like predicted oxidoreductase